MMMPISLQQLEQYERKFSNLRKEKFPISDAIIQKIEEFLIKTIQENDFCMCVPLAVLPLIISNDVFKNQMELGHGTTMGGENTRKMVTKELFGCAIDQLKPCDYPKYGMLMEKNKLRQVCIDSDVVYHYGNVIVTFKKENIMQRTTMTVGSSIDFGECYCKRPTLVTDPKATCVRCKDASREIIGFYEHIVSGELLSNMPASLSRVYDGMLGYEYYEVQYHGRLSFSRDVESVDLFPMGDMDQEEFKRIVPALEKLHIAHSILSF